MPGTVDASWGDEWAEVADVVVVGSGAAGYGAAYAAAREGASVIVLEKSGFVGGTTGKSGGVLWICNNPLMQAQGLVDDRSDALRYLARSAFPTLYSSSHPTLGLPEDRYRLLEAFYDEGAPAIAALIDDGVLDLEPLAYPDYYADLPEDTAPNGRTLQPKYPKGWRRGIDATGGQQLVEQLRAGAERHGARTLVDHRAAHIVRNAAGEAVGLEVRTGRRAELIGARKGIVFCSGGFLHNRRMALEYLRGPVLGGAAAEGATGDFVEMGIEVGAQLGNMSHAWWDEVVVELAARVPQTIRDVYSPFGDAMLMVNRYGRRVVNEKAPYNERGQVHFHWDAGRHEYPNFLTFMIFDDTVVQSTEASRFRFPVPLPGEHDDFVISAPTWPELSASIAARLDKLSSTTGNVRLAPAFTNQLVTTIARFNEFARNGKDLDFGRGETPIEQTWAGPPRAGAATGSMYPLSVKGPYHCVIIGPGALDTKGGPVIDAAGRVLLANGEPIAGLFGAGNCIASPAGQGYWGPGGTIGLAFTFGYIAGRTASHEAERHPE